jgi:quercetin dioxygenase-like cupin family protein
MSNRLVGLIVLAAVTAAASAGLSAPEIRLTPADADSLPSHEAGAGTSGVTGIRTTVVAGDPTASAPYTIRLIVPSNTRIQAHTHRDDRHAVVVAGTWYFGYGSTADSSLEKALPPGSFYTEPAGIAHFAETRSESVTVYITGFGSTDTHYLSAPDTH